MKMNIASMVKHVKLSVEFIILSAPNVLPAGLPRAIQNVYN